MAIERASLQPVPVETDGFYGVGQEVYEDIRSKEKGRKASLHFQFRVIEKFVGAVLQVEPLREHLSDQQLAEIAGTNSHVIGGFKERTLKKWSNGHA